MVGFNPMLPQVKSSRLLQEEQGPAGANTIYLNGNDLAEQRPPA
jgi:hypothetical protein